MKLANHGGRAVLVIDDAIADVEEASGGRFGPDPMAVYDDWAAFGDFAAGVTTGHASLVETELRGPVNFVAPETVTNEQFTRALAAAVGRPSFLRVPSFAAKLAPGGMSEEMLLGGAPIVPRKLLESGYTFRWPRLGEALKAMLQD